MKRTSILLVLLMALVSILAACQSTPSTTTLSTQTPTSTQPTTSAEPTTSTPEPLTPQYGGILKLVVRNPSNYFGYPGDMASSGAVEVSTPCLERLANVDPEGKFVPTGLTTAYEVAQDGKSITFTLREGVKFHDGTDFNAEAAKWALDEGMRVRLAGTELFETVDVVDD